jgi:hypothetical protein
VALDPGQSVIVSRCFLCCGDNELNQGNPGYLIYVPSLEQKTFYDDKAFVYTQTSRRFPAFFDRTL